MDFRSPTARARPDARCTKAMNLERTGFALISQHAVAPQTRGPQRRSHRGRCRWRKAPVELRMDWRRQAPKRTQVRLQPFI